MTPQQSRYYIEAKDRLRAVERLELMDAMQYPTLQAKDKGKKHREVYKKAYPENFKNSILKTTDLELI